MDKTKIQVNARILKNPYLQLQADAARRGLSSAPALLNYILNTLYHGTEDEWAGIFKTARSR